MDIEPPRCFLIAARADSFAQAEEALFTSPSTVSRRISALEKELGVRVFDRSRAEITLTDTGLRLLHEAEAIVSHCDALKTFAQG